MRIHRGEGEIGAADRGASAAIGNFDGVHRGHRAVIDLARRAGAPLGVVTFAPHPRRLFQPDAPIFELMTPESKARRLEILGVDQLYELTFDRALAGLAPETFCEAILAERLGLSHVVAGADFRFGAGRAGDAALLRREGARLGFDVTIADLVMEGAEDCSSSAIRAALAEGRPEAAAGMLGHLHRVEGEVIRGDQRGRDLGFPTANQRLEGVLRPRFGVYASVVDVLDGPHRGRHLGATSIGERPTFGINAPNCETFLLDFSGDLYGARISVGLVAFLRPELKFDGMDALIEQMDRDVAEARAHLARVNMGN